MARPEADQLQTLIEKAKSWPVWQASGPAVNVRQGMSTAVGSYGKSAADIQLWIAMREADRDRIKQLIDWPGDRPYRMDPLADRISQAFSDLLFGEDPEIKSADEADQDNLEELINANTLPSELRRAAADASSEGEVWYRIYTDPDQADRPLIEFHSRLDVVPLFRGRKVVACAFISHLASQEIKTSNNQTDTQYWRHVEIQTDGLARNLLYRGNLSTLGNSLPLTAYPDTAEYPEEWDHGLDVMLAGRIVNKVGRDWRLGMSDYQGIKDLLLDLNEARTIMAENARLTAKSRMVVPLEAVKDGKFDAGQDVIVHETLDQAMGEGKPGPYAVLQYTFEADSLTKHINELRSSALTGVGLMEQFVGSGTNMEGNSGVASGTSLKTRLIPTTLAASGRGRWWDDEVPEAIRKLQMVDELPETKFGFGHDWKDAKTAPSFERSSVLPEDPTEEVDRHVAAVGGEVESIETAVKGLHPDWDEKEVTEEIKRIKEDRASAAPDNNFGNDNTDLAQGDGLPGSQPKPGVPNNGGPPVPGAKPEAVPPSPSRGGSPPPRPPARTPTK